MIKIKRLSKWEIACLIEQLPGNIAWSNPSLATRFVDRYTRDEFVIWYNGLVSSRGLDLPVLV